MIWGFAFTAQSVGAEHMGPWTFLALRAWLGVMTLIVFITVRWLIVRHTSEGRRAYETMRELSGNTGDTAGNGRMLMVSAGIATGVLLCLASFLQQAGIAYTSVAKSSFITAMYVVIVPVISFVSGRKPGKPTSMASGRCSGF